MRSIFAAALLLIGLGTTAAYADTLASGPAHGGPTQRVAVCYIFAAGGNLTVSDVQIIKEPDATVLPVVTNNCIGTFGSGGICRSVSNISSGDVVACRVTLTPKANARASMEIRNSTNGILNSRDLR